MNQFLQTSNQYASLPNLAHLQRRQLLKVFWLLALGLFIYELFWTETSSLVTNFGSILITAAALLPSYLWCSGKALGMPIFPLFALTYIWTYALPLVTKHPKAITYSPASHLFASFTVAVFLGLGTIIWFRFVKSPPPLPKSYRALSSQKGDVFFLFVLVISIFFNIANTGGWLFLFLYGGIFTAVRAAILGLTVLASFVLAYQLGTQELSKSKSRLFLILLITYMVTDAVSLLLVGAASTFLVATVAFIIGRQKISVLPIVIALICFSFLHSGKAEMRAKYWFGNQPAYVQVWQYPSWFVKWAGHSWDYFNKQDDLSTSSKKQSFLERSSVIHLFLLAQDKSPESIPYLHGKTYAILPQLLVPRIFNPKKIRSHEGTYLLNIHYGLQTREATYTTTIGWGLLAESYANFGLLGCTGLAIVLGTAYGKITRWSINAPILSTQSLFTVLFLAYAFQTEWSAGVYVAALAQSSVVIVGIVVFLMQTY
ncbi:hypothetical protein [Calothrix rhizosoleniae]|uniref:hypothetical protein n=1 Tax=Calothrix rhizosoleniae TaxID=888997 RepID=UPI000B49B4A0|nr:hypothetical protein [Calothrix rhizosoleniae]